MYRLEVDSGNQRAQPDLGVAVRDGDGSSETSYRKGLHVWTLSFRGGVNRPGSRGQREHKNWSIHEDKREWRALFQLA